MYIYNFQYETFIGVKVACAGVTVRRVAKALCAISNQYIKMPTTGEMRASADELFRRFNIPDAPLGVDGTHIKLAKRPLASGKLFIIFV
jgi:hypothetical protein